MKFELENANIKYAVIGDPVAHSVSPAMQNAAFMAAGRDERYGKFHVKPEDLAEFVEFARTHLAGFNATVPHKKMLLDLLDEVDPEAAAAGSVNTVAIKDGRLYGTSTDGYGLRSALHEAFGLTLTDARVLLLGAGGAAQAAAFEFVRHGAGELIIANRTVLKAEKLAAQLNIGNCRVSAIDIADHAAVSAAAAAADVVVQATSSGLHADDPPPVGLESLISARAIFDMIYGTTKVLEFARENDIPCADGRAMLLHQGAASFSLWTSQPAPLAAMRAALDRALMK